METPMLYMFDGQQLPPYVLSKNDILFPGSFNPYHYGHKELADHVFGLTGNPVIYTLNITHPDKPEIPESEIIKRIKQFEWKGTILITRGLNLFIEKARAYPFRRFLIGMDTLERMLDQKYYKFSIRDMMEEFRGLETTFLVGKRPHAGKITKSSYDSHVRTLEEVLAEYKVTDYRGLFTELDNRPNTLSSTSIRNQTGEKS